MTAIPADSPGGPGGPTLRSGLGRVPLRRLAWLAGALTVGFGVVAWATAPHLVAALLPRAGSFGPGTLFEHRDQVPLEVYQIKARSWVTIATAIGLSAAALASVIGAAIESRRWRRVLAAVLCFAATAALFELATRAVLVARGIDIEIYRNFSFQSSPQLFVPDPELGYRMLPSVARNALASEFSVIYRTNRLGLREREIDPVPGPAMRILFLGDSHTFGWGVESAERFTDRLAGKLESIEPVNAGVPGWGIHQMRAWLARDGLALRPDLVVVAVIAGDFQRALRDRLPVDLQAESGVEPPRPGEQNKEPLVVRRRQMEQASLRGQLGAAARATLGRSWLLAFARTQVEVRIRRRDLEAREREAATLVRAGWERYGWADREQAVRAVAEEELRALAETTRAASLPLLVAWIDSTPNTWEGALARRLGIEFVDLTARLAEPALRFRIDPHYNPAGHQRIAESLAPILRDRYVAPFRPAVRAPPSRP